MMPEEDRTEALIKAADHWSTCKGIRAMAQAMLFIAGFLVIVIAMMSMIGIIDTHIALQGDALRPLLIALHLLAACILAAGPLWFLLAPRQASHAAMAFSAASTAALLLALHILAVTRGVKPNWLWLIVLPLLLIYWALQSYGAIKSRAVWSRFWKMPPPTSDLREVERLAKDLAAADPRRDEDVVALRHPGVFSWEMMRVRLADPAVLARYGPTGKPGHVIVARKDNLCYLLDESERRRRRPLVVLWLKDHLEEEEFWVARLDPAAKKRLTAWKPSEQDFSLKRTWRGPLVTPASAKAEHKS